MSYRFLIVDVSATVRALAKHTIRQADFGGAAKFYEASTASEVMDVLADHGVDLVLIDPRLPDADGADLIERIMAEPDTRHTPVVVMSARPEQRRLDVLRTRGVKAVVRKPLGATFQDTIRDVLEPTHV